MLRYDFWISTSLHPRDITWEVTGDTWRKARRVSLGTKSWGTLTKRSWSRSRGISDLNVRAPRRHCRRRITVRPSLDAGLTRETRTDTASASFTCLEIPHLLRREAERAPFHGTWLSKDRRRRRLARTAGSEAILLLYETHSPCSCSCTRRGTADVAPPTPWKSPGISQRINTSNGDGRAFFTPVFTPRHSGRFDAFFTIVVAKRRPGGRSFLREVIFRFRHIDRLRPEAPKSKPQPNIKSTNNVAQRCHTPYASPLEMFRDLAFEPNQIPELADAICRIPRKELFVVKGPRSGSGKMFDDKSRDPPADSSDLRGRS
ncbi:hypothetical protein KM043_016213 [Ampulex compressa]|nr:hypothetical protein KM043_016213 [Ampulex compressa]